jgi:hypothetical protein
MQDYDISSKKIAILYEYLKENGYVNKFNEVTEKMKDDVKNRKLNL